MNRYLDWKSVMDNQCVSGVRDPITGSILEKEIFNQSFQKILDQLDGRYVQDSVNYFFQETPLNQGILEFKGEDEKSEFIDWAIDNNLLPQIEELMEGEDLYNKQQRFKESGFLDLECYHEKDTDLDLEASPKNLHEPILSEEEKSVKVALNMQKGVTKKLTTKNNCNPNKLKKSLDMLYQHLLSASRNFPENRQLKAMLSELQDQYKIVKPV